MKVFIQVSNSRLAAKSGGIFSQFNTNAMKKTDIKIEYTIGNLVFTLKIPHSVMFLLNSGLDPEGNYMSKEEFSKLVRLKTSLKDHLHSLWYEVINTKIPLFPVKDYKHFDALDYSDLDDYLENNCESEAERYLRLSDVISCAVQDIAEIERIYDNILPF